MLEYGTRRVAGGIGDETAAYQAQQQRKMLLTLILLLAALTSVLIKDRQFWFGSDQTTTAEEATTSAVANSTVQTTAPVVAKIRKHSTVAPAATTPATTPTATVTARKALPALDVQVVSGDTHRNLGAKSNSLKVEVAPGSSQIISNSVQMAGQSAPLAGATEKQSAPSNGPSPYPLLAKQMKVQGSVVLQALVGEDGIIRDLRVVSGPAILSAAARQAVREWKFKPYLQNGHAVETMATITVNLTINVLDNSSSAAASFYSQPVQTADSGY